MNGKHIKDLSDQSKPNVIIYAGDGECYWREGGCGYTNAQMAGVYTREEAYRVAGHCGPEKRIELHSVPADHVPTLRAALREARAALESIADQLERIGDSRKDALFIERAKAAIARIEAVLGA